MNKAIKNGLQRLSKISSINYMTNEMRNEENKY